MFKLFKKLGKKEFLFVFLSIFFIVIQVFLDLKLPDYIVVVVKIFLKKDFIC